jgi:hypothetical protein
MTSSALYLDSFATFVDKYVPFLVITIALLAINRIFLHLLLGKYQDGQLRRKFIFKLIKGSAVFQFMQEIIRDWKTYRNTMRNSQKII